MPKSFIRALLLALLITATTQAQAADVTYGDRQLTVESYIGIGDWMVRLMASGKDGSLYALTNTEAGPKLLRIPYRDETWHEAEAESVYDFGKRSFWSPFYDAAADVLYVNSDVQNDETFNQYRFDPSTKTLTQSTFMGYSPSASVTKRGTLLYIGRPDKTGKVTCLAEISPVDATTDDRFLCDTEARRFYPFQAPQENADGTTIAFVSMVGESRSRLNLAVVDRASNAIKVLTDEATERSSLQLLGWRGAEILILKQDKDTKPEVFAVDSVSGALRSLITTDQPLGNAFYVPGSDTVIAEFRSSDGSVGKLVALSLAEGATPVTSDSHDYVLWWWNRPQLLPDGALAMSAKLLSNGEWIVARIDLAATQSADLLKIGLRFAVNDKPKAKACEASDVYFPTFDVDPATGAQRQIHAILWKPAVTLAGEPAGIIYAHGGPSGQSTKDAPADIKLLCNLGYTVLAPNVRGSSGYGQAFEDLNNGDWGGGDHMDYEYGRRYLAASFGIQAARIGITGGSYGGYMTDWAVTRPDNQFAFGISDFGMADLVLEAAKSVVANNTISDMGDPVVNADLYKERSPLTWADSMNVPFLLTHGSRDQRCVVEDTRIFYEQLKALGKPVEYVELDGEGHGYKYLDTVTLRFQALLDFLWEHAPVTIAE